ncbi:hypothetical protein CA13_60480 [Planctomycetes bacterium CA13]|uniref:Uncharacterized protein n=1 Tax=Novipirellula herctigrandis TaxID=2527986 RepID=A0A5C5ZBR6_9BACT|nr:hypothetical protein CA13_60480 [Planctomycetes bacterium CA13]
MEIASSRLDQARQAENLSQIEKREPKPRLVDREDARSNEKPTRTHCRLAKERAEKLNLSRAAGSIAKLRRRD